MELIEERSVNNSPYRNKDGEIISGEKNWNDIINSFPPLYPENNQNSCEKIYLIQWDYGENNYININFFYTKTCLLQKFLKISIELKCYNPSDPYNECTIEEINELYTICNSIIKIGIENITYPNDTDIKFLTKSREFPIIAKSIIPLDNCITKYYFNYYYPINRDEGDNVTIKCIIDLCSKIFNSRIKNNLNN